MVSIWLFEWAHRVMTELANNSWLGIISSKHIHRSGSANWISLRFLLPGCDLAVAVACCYGQQLFFWPQANYLVYSESNYLWRWHLRRQIRGKERRLQVAWERARLRKRAKITERNVTHTHQAGSFLIFRDTLCC